MTRPDRVGTIVAAARTILERAGRDALTMRRLGEVLGVRAPSLYKHLPGKRAVEAALIDDVLREIGTACHAAVTGVSPSSAVRRLLAAYREYALAHPNLYRLATNGPLDREALTPGLEEWAGTPFFIAAGEDPHLAQALWSFAHGMVILELDNRIADASDLDRTWTAGATAFTAAARH